MVDDTTGRREKGAVDANTAPGDAISSPSTVVHVASSAAWQEGGPGFGVIKLRGLSPQGEPVGDVIRLGNPGCNNHSFSISQHSAGEQDAPSAPGLNVAWVESAFGDVSGVGRIMFQRCGFLAGSPGEAAQVVGLAGAANDNATWVADGRGSGALGCQPTVASLDGGDTLVAWVGTDGNAHGRLYGTSHLGGSVLDQGRADAPEYAAVNAALADLGPVVAAPDGDRRVQVLETRPGSFAVMWLALADNTLVLRGGLFATPPESKSDGSTDQRWTEYPIADIHLPHGATGEFSVKGAGQGSPDIVVSYARFNVETNRVDVLARRIDGVGPHAEIAQEIGHVAAEYLVSSAPAPDPGLPEVAERAVGPHADLFATAQSHETDAAEGQPAQSATIAVEAAADVTAPVVKAIQSGGFVVAWQTPGVLEGTVKLTMALFNAPAGGSTLIDVTDNAVADVAPAVAGFGTGAAIGYVRAGAGDLIVEAFDAAGTQIGTELVVDESGGIISEIAIASQKGRGEGAPFQDVLAVVYVQDNGDADGGDAGYGNIMLQRYGLSEATEAGPQELVALGGDGEHDGDDHPVQLSTDGEGSVGRAPSVTGLPDGDLAIVWVENNGTEETIKGCIVQPDGEQVLRIDLTGLLGEAGIADGTKPTLLDTSDGDIVVSWLQPDEDSDGFVVMAALYKASGTGAWLAPEEPIRLQAFDHEPEDFSVTISDEDSTFLTVTWRTDGSGHSGGDRVLSQRYDIEGNDVGWPVRVADREMPEGGQQLSAQTLSAAGLLDGQIVVVYTEQKSNGDVDLTAQVIDARSMTAAGSDAGTATAPADTAGYATSVDQEIAIDVLSGAAGNGATVSQINGVPITMAAPVDVGSGWVQLREDGRLTVSPNAGFTGPIAFDYTIADTASGLESEKHLTINVEPGELQAPLALVDPVTALAEDVSTAADIKLAEITAPDEELSTDGLSVAGLDADMFKIVGTTLYLKAGVDLDFETKPTLSVEVRSGGSSRADEHVNFTLDIENATADDAPGGQVLSDTFVFASGLGDTSSQPGLVNEVHETIDLSSSGYATFQQLMDSGALVQDGADVVITIDPHDPAHSDKIILRGLELSQLTSSDFKF